METNSKLINFIKSGLFILIALLPFAYNPRYFFPFFSFKLAIFQGAIVIFSFLFLYAVHQGKIKVPKLDFIGISFLLFIVSMFVSSIFGLDFGHSFWSSFERGTGLLFYLNLFVLFVLLKGVLTKERDWWKMFLFISISMSVLAIFTFFDQNLGDFFGGGFTLGNSSFVGASLLFSIFLSFIVMPKLFGNKYGYPLAITFFLIAILSPIFLNVLGIISGEVFNNFPISLIGEARGAFLGLFVGVIASLILFLSLSKNRIMKVFGIIFGVLLIFFIIFGINRLVTPGTNINQTFSEAAWPNRFVYWDIGIEGFKQNPAFGYGHEMFVVEFSKNFDPIILTPKYLNEFFVDRPHNAYIELIYNFGIVGAIFFLVLLISLFRAIFLARKNGSISNLDTSLFCGFIIAYLIQNIFIFDTLIPLILFVTTFAFISFLGKESVGGLESNLFYEKMKHPISPIIFGSILLAIFIFTSYLPAYKSKSFVRIATAKSSYDRINLYDNGKIISLGDSTDTAVISEMIFNQISKFVDPKIRLSETDKEVIAQDIKGAIDFTERSAERFPYYQRTFTVLASLNNLLAYFSPENSRGSYILKSEEWANKAVESSPNNPQGFWVLSQVYEILKSWDLSYEMLDKAIEIAPYQKTSYMRGMIVAMEEGNKQKYNKYLTGLLNLFPKLEEGKDYPAWGSISKVE